MAGHCLSSTTDASLKPAGGSLRAALSSRIGTANGVGFYERPPESMRAEELEPPEPGAQRLWDGNTDVDPYDDAQQQPGRSRTDLDYSEGVRS